MHLQQLYGPILIVFKFSITNNGSFTFELCKQYVLIITGLKQFLNRIQPRCTVIQNKITI